MLVPILDLTRKKVKLMQKRWDPLLLYTEKQNKEALVKGGTCKN